MFALLRDTVAILSTVLAIGIGAHAWRQRSFGLACLAYWMAALAACAWILVLEIAPDGRLTSAGRLLVPLTSTPAGPLLLGYVLFAVRGRRVHWAWFVPFAIHVAAVMIFGTGLNRWINLTSVIWLEYALLLASWVVWARGDGPVRERLAPCGVLAAATGLQLANAAQTVALLGFIDFSPIVRGAPFVVVSAWSLAAIAFALLESPTLRRLAPALAPLPDAGDRELFAQVQALMRERRPWIEPDFEVGALARMLGTHPNAVSRALSRAGNTSFYEFVNDHRLREAERLLSDPRESQYKIEALCRQAGFRARSTFFKLFRARTGQTPSEYRAARTPMAQGGQSSPSAH